MSSIINKTVEYVKCELSSAEGGHDWFHVQRVWNTARLIAKYEDVNDTVVELAALLHDIADAKFHDGNEDIGIEKASTFLQSNKVDESITEHVLNIIKHMSYRSSLSKETGFSSKEMEVVQDADRLDAIGAIGIARAFNYGGYKNRAFYDPSIEPNLNMTKEEYKNSTAPTINHFYEKLLLLKDLMNTQTGRKIAEKRHQYMEGFLEEFYDEWYGRDL